MTESGNSGVRGRFRFPLWMLVFVLPTIAALGFAYLSLTWQWAKQIEQAQADIAQLKAEELMASVENHFVRQQMAPIEAQLEKYRQPQAIVQQAQLRLYGGGLGQTEWGLSYFAYQASDDDIRELVLGFQQELNDASEKHKLRILDFLERMLFVFADRKRLFAHDVSAIAKQLGNDPSAKVAARAKRVDALYQAALSAENQQ
ncbi:hypothetical protein DTL42_08515 [Bremerella cremea]|uniref:Uncharacterized protein n=1 Tax=Bremerella cremea TaxID=1031537 RepID=A0A368KVF3_9BACT|nr:hypothetical protein [Bremerella cremea]RCS52862.1 hypothetical protein DTL42_08515 [Bremerella cremea]